MLSPGLGPNPTPPPNPIPPSYVAVVNTKRARVPLGMPHPKRSDSVAVSDDIRAGVSVHHRVVSVSPYGDCRLLRSFVRSFVCVTQPDPFALIPIPSPGPASGPRAGPRPSICLSPDRVARALEPALRRAVSSPSPHHCGAVSSLSCLLAELSHRRAFSSHSVLAGLSAL